MVRLGSAFIRGGRVPSNRSSDFSAAPEHVARCICWTGTETRPAPIDCRVGRQFRRRPFFFFLSFFFFNVTSDGVGFDVVGRSDYGNAVPGTCHRADVLVIVFFRVYRRCRSRRRSAAWTSTRRWAAPIRCAWRPSTRRRRCCRPSPPPPPATSPSSSSAPPRDTWKRYVHRFSLLGYGAVAESHLVRCRGRGNVCEPFRPRKLFFLGTYLDISQCR